MTGFFVTGTDTGVGKTYVTAMLARLARRQGKKVFAFKPIETGCVLGELGADQACLHLAAGGWQSGPLQGCYRLTQPAAPRVAADAEGVVIDLDYVSRVAQQGREASDFVLIEGAGGWRVPITSSEDMAALARRIGLPVIIVGHAGLGTINHSLLTIEAVLRDGLTVAALVLSRRPEQDRTFALSNAEQVARQWGGRVLLCEGDGETLDALTSEPGA
jgi:dethiobiotin synthetase